ncbi:MAG TPA: F0F1 ATP synthase subunit gamma [Acidimicrobiales bacterium]|jgi:F-type H+-transporting ATPase subunit gamma|nr:F0F1 ATP synthase subunit gamma [Acidimicrobiales bacterium]
MAGGKERVLRRRIKSVQSTKKITKAMELISASRIAKAQQRVAAARPYSEQITEVIRNLAAAGAASSSPLLQSRADVRKIAIVVISGDRGLAGAYNSNVIRAAERRIAEVRAEGKEYALVTVGRKALGYFRFRNYKVDASFTGFSDQPAYENAREIAQFVAEQFESGEYDQVELAYTQFLSVGTQRAVARRLVPLDSEAITEASQGDGPKADYEFEPSPTEILDRLLPRYVEARLFAALLESAASEHAARQRAMKSATDNAEDLITKLSRIMNRARQDAITTEIMEIVGGAEALAQDKTAPGELLLDHTDWPHVFPHDPHNIVHR